MNNLSTIHPHVSCAKMHEMLETKFILALSTIANLMKIITHLIRELHSAPMHAIDDGKDRTQIYMLLQQKTTEDAKQLQQHILPLIEKVMKEFLNTAMLYDRFTFQKWRQYLPVQLKQSEQCLVLIEQANKLLASQIQSLQERKTQVDVLTTEMKGKAVDIEQSNVICDTFYVVLDTIQGIISTTWNPRRAFQERRNQEKLTRALDLTREKLIPAISTFIQGLQECEEFLQMLVAALHEISTLPMDHKTGSEHFELMKKYTKSITASCSLYIINGASVKSDLDSISMQEPHETHV